MARIDNFHSFGGGYVIITLMGISRSPRWRGSTGGVCLRRGSRRRQRKLDSRWRRCGEVNQERRTRRQMATNML